MLTPDEPSLVVLLHCEQQVEVLSFELVHLVSCWLLEEAQHLGDGDVTILQVRILNLGKAYDHGSEISGHGLCDWVGSEL